MKRVLGLLLCGLAAGCGGSVPAPATHDSVVMADVYQAGPGPKLARVDLCTAVDQERMRPASTPTREFGADERSIFLVGKFKDIEPSAQVEIRWFLDADREPQLVSQVGALEKFSFVAFYSPTEATLFVGNYTVRIYVDGQEVAALPFTVHRAENSTQELEVRGVELGQKVDEKYRVIRPVTRFEPSTSSVIASFDVSGVQFGNVLTARWSKGTQLLHQEEISLSSDKRYTTNVQTVGAMPRGVYNLELHFGGEVLVHRDFTVGDPDKATPKVQRADIGLGVGKENQPKKKTSVFKKDASVLFLGLVFADVPPGSTLEVSWIELSRQGDMTRYITKSVMDKGGDGTLGVTWEPKIMLAPGSYKAVVAVNGEQLSEVPFTVK